MNAAKLQTTQPILVLLYGFPGAGKTYFARQLCEDLKAAHLEGDRIRFELFEEPRYDKQESEIVEHLLKYMTQEFLSAGVSVVYDMNASRVLQRRELRDLARKAKAQFVLIWFQLDLDTAFIRSTKRDHRKSDDKYAMPMNKKTFEQIVSQMQNPGQTEDYLVISGKHTYTTQRGAVFKRLYDLGLVTADSASSKMVKPELVNLVPSRTPPGRFDPNRRNIHIR